MLGISLGLAGCGVVCASNSQGANCGLCHAIFSEPVHSGMLPIAVYVVDGRLTSPAGLEFVKGTYTMALLAFHQLSLAQLEERKTVTVATIAFIRYLEARGSIPRGETLLLHVVDMLYLLLFMSCEEIHFYGLRENFDFLRDMVSICAILAQSTTYTPKKRL